MDPDSRGLKTKDKKSQEWLNFDVRLCNERVAKVDHVATLHKNRKDENRKDEVKIRKTTIAHFKITKVPKAIMFQNFFCKFESMITSAFYFVRTESNTRWNRYCVSF